MSEWVTKPLSELADFVMGQSPDGSTISEHGPGLPFLQGSAEFGSSHPQPAAYVHPPLKVAPTDSILISVRAPVGTMNRADQAYGIGRGVAAIVGRERSPLFLRYALELGARWLERRSQGSTFLAVGSSDLRDMPITTSVPPNACEFAAKIVTLIDTQIEQTEALIAKQEKVRAGLMQDLFTRGIDKSGRLRPPREEAPELYHETRLGWLPKAWEAIRLDGLTTKIVDGVHHTPTYVDAGIPFVTVKNLTKGRGIDLSDINYVTLSDHRGYQRRADPKYGDVLVTKDGTLGVARCVPKELDEVSIFVSVALLRPIRDRLAPAFLREFFETNYYSRQMGYLSAGSGLKHIHLEHFRKFVIPLPDTAEQAAIMDALACSDHIIKYEDRMLAELRMRRSGLMQDLLTGRVPVNALLKQRAAA